MKPTTTTCSECPFWHALPQQEGMERHTDGLCQRFPPARGVDMMSRYPVINGNDPKLICGEHPLHPARVTGANAKSMRHPQRK